MKLFLISVYYLFGSVSFCSSVFSPINCVKAIIVVNKQEPFGLQLEKMFSTKQKGPGVWEYRKYNSLRRSYKSNKTFSHMSELHST